ncbi:zf-TFIIB domain-containing protein [Immundisolibacter sp.]|uniref:TFIIB-type zinc ribbon-containing protein n=1 Tax=Immundisolibacter sp. TaxID=1934948 RepID=UPI0026073430|nr:zf-TFIIB domain-containing protein [Immundisolibacter sp.]MDD3649861.1 zf-TFIIB domain-containing protein [Immundisolibacter sp.]
MQCPACQVDLQIAERHFIEIDYCPKCRGVWLDRGELDKIIERAAANEPLRSAPRPVAGEPAPRRREGDDHDRHSRHHKSRRRGFLGELFDFD